MYESLHVAVKMYINYSFFYIYSLYGCSEKFWESLATPTANFLDIFNGLLFRSIPWLRTKFEIIVIGVLGGRCKGQSSGRVSRRGSGMEPFEKALMSSYRRFIVTFPLSLFFTHFRDIAAFVLLHTTFASDSPLVSSNFPHILLDVDRWPLGHEERRCCLIVHAINFQDLQRMWSWSTNVTDGRTNAHMHGRHAIARPRFAV